MSHDTTTIDRADVRARRPSRRNPEWGGLDAWIDGATGISVEFDSMHLDSCCPHESWWRLTGADSRLFRVEGPLEFTPKLEAYNWDKPATPGMVDAWMRFCAVFA